MTDPRRITEWAEPKSLAEYAAESSVSESGWECPRCGCRDLRVLDTRESADGNIARTKYCRHCGKDGPRIYTKEKPYKVTNGEV